ncbi:hypothetical protein F7734_25560 [Scytonema sp. UIC 10036]|uniref:hypothetical protein n=1 Tax=Scytonema sp. UIC 10036 TaxID=2304196 RepID=UPI0012DAEED0|nr:hypothetical protein [Scytonema sp. UIC 10036]MUG95546.1 hypothetical protein [Scytonema sp. UIC 10036]
MMNDKNDNNEDTHSELANTEVYSSEYKDIYQLLDIPAIQTENLPIWDLEQLDSKELDRGSCKYQRLKPESSRIAHWLEYEDTVRLERFKLPTDSDTNFNLDLYLRDDYKVGWVEERNPT